MPFEPGHKKSKGRPKGVRNKRTQEVAEIIANLDFCPVTALVHFAKGNWEALGYKTPQKEISIGDGKTLWVDRIDEQLRQKSAKELMPYVFPQLKGIEFKGEAGENLIQSFTQLMAQAAKEDSNGDGTEPSGN